MLLFQSNTSFWIKELKMSMKAINNFYGKNKSNLYSVNTKIELKYPSN